MQVDRARRIIETSSGILNNNGGRAPNLVQKLKAIYEDAKCIVKNMSCGRRDDVARPAYDLLEQRSARPSEARDTRSTGIRREVRC